MQKRDLHNIAFVVIGALVLSLIINFSFSIKYEIIPTVFTKENWFNFWTTYVTGVMAVIVGYCTIVSANRNSQKAILQQNAILIRQKSDEIYHEIADEIKCHVSLFNIVNFTSTILSMNEDDLAISKEKVVEKKVSIEERRLQWELLKRLYLNSETLHPITDEYDKVWNEATAKLVEYANLEYGIYNVIDEIKLSEKTVSILTQLINSITERASTSSDKTLVTSLSQYEQQKEDALKKQYKLNKRYKDMVAQIHQSISVVSVLQEEEVNASSKFLAQLVDYVFVRAIKEKIGKK